MEKKKEITVDASLENIEVVTDWVNGLLYTWECSMKAQIQIDVAIDELFGNIAHYAYPKGMGKVTVIIELEEEPKRVSLTFVDGGIPYNPLEKDDPDTTLGIEERQIGGLGIFMVKKTMDKIEYEYREEKNRLKIIKAIG